MSIRIVHDDRWTTKYIGENHHMTVRELKEALSMLHPERLDEPVEVMLVTDQESIYPLLSVDEYGRMVV